MFADYLQYTVGYLQANELRRDLEKDDAAEANYNYKNWKHVARIRLFWAKQAAIIVAVLWMVGIVFLKVITTKSLGG